MSWIEQIDLIDKQLHADGCPDGLRQKAVSDIACLLIQIEKEQKRLKYRDDVLTAVANCSYSAIKAAELLRCTEQNVRYHLKKHKEHS